MFCTDHKKHRVATRFGHSNVNLVKLDDIIACVLSDSNPAWHESQGFNLASAVHSYKRYMLERGVGVGGVLRGAKKSPCILCYKALPYSHY